MFKILLYLALTFLLNLFMLATFVNHGQIRQGLWRYVALLMATIFFAIEPVHAFLGQVLSNNIAWLLSYICLICGLTHGFSVAWEAAKLEIPKWFKLYALGNILALVLMYIFFISKTPDWPAHDMPRSLADLIFMEIAYIFTIVAICIPHSGFRLFYRQADGTKDRVHRTRWKLFGYSGLTSGLGYGLKAILTLIFYLVGDVHEGALSLSLGLMGIGIVLLVLSSVPESAYRPFRKLSHLFDIRNLMKVNSYLENLLGVEDRLSLDWWRCYKHSKIRLNQVLVSITDYHRILLQKREKQAFELDAKSSWVMAELDSVGRTQLELVSRCHQIAKRLE